jgi:sarcosine oxidase, subunit gamma
MPDTDWLHVKPPAARLLLRSEAPARAAAAAVWGVGFAEESCRARVLGTRATLWLGPDEHLMLQESRDAALPIEELEQALAAYPHALVDISHRQAALEISGTHAEEILAGACPLDLDLRRFPIHMCTRTVLAKAEIVLWRTAPKVFHLEVWRSFQAYAQELLREIAREYRAAP